MSAKFVGTRLEPSVYNKLKKAAVEEGRSVSKQIEKYVKEGVNNKKERTE